jgi:hypothetical protein
MTAHRAASRLGRRLAAIAACAVLAVLALPVTTLAGYPPGSFPGPAPGGAFRTIVMSAMVCPEGADMKATFGRASVELAEPAGAFDTCTQVTIFAADTSVIGPLLPSHDVLVDAFAVGWDGPASNLALALTIHDSAITSRSAPFKVTATGVSRVDAARSAGKVTFSLDAPMGFAVATPAATPTVRPTLPATSTTTLAPADRPSNGFGVILALMVGVTGVVMLLLSRPRPRRRRP